MPKSKVRARGFSLAEIIVAMLLVGAVLGMIMAAVLMLDKAVANERVVAFPEANPNTLWTSWGFWEAKAAAAASPPQSFVANFSLAPSRACDAKAEGIWRAMHDLYEQSTAVAVIPEYVLHDMSTATNVFLGYMGYLSTTDLVNFNPPFSYQQLKDPSSVRSILSSRFSGAFNYWGQSGSPQLSSLNVDTNSYRAATIFFLAPKDRILGILRVRAWQFTGTANPYRYYEVGLARPRWAFASNHTPVVVDPKDPWNVWMMVNDHSPNFVEDYYRFAEDKRFPQDLIFPPTSAQLDAYYSSGSSAPTTASLSGRDVVVRLATQGENYDLQNPLGTVVTAWTLNQNPGASRRQVSLAPSPGAAGPVLTAGTDEWHLILPDPGLGQAEERALLRQNGATLTAAQLTFDKQIRRQGKYGCVLSLYP